MEESLQWLVGFNNWCLEWEAFLAEETINEYGTRCLTHEKLARARDSLIRLIKSGNLFTYLDPDLADQTLTCEQPDRRRDKRSTPCHASKTTAE